MYIYAEHLESIPKKNITAVTSVKEQNTRKGNSTILAIPFET